MSEIPEDIAKTARDIMDEACLPETLVANGVDGAIRLAIARAILAERKRCANLCDAMGAREQEGYGLTRASQNYFRARNAIRRGDHPENHRPIEATQ